MTDNIREKLVEILECITGCAVEECRDCELSKNIEQCVEFRKKWLTDKLLANGVTVQTEGEKLNELNEAYDLGVDSVLHDHFGLSWDDAAELRKEVKRLQEATKWIPVTERLPQEGEGTVLVCGSRGGIYTAYLERSGKYPKWHKLNSKNHYCDPTHWMPLPPAPKGEK